MPNRIFSYILITLLSSVYSLPLYSQTIAEKIQGLHKGSLDLDKDTQTNLKKVNHDLAIKKTQLKQLYVQAGLLFRQNACPNEYQNLLLQINKVRHEIASIENDWRAKAMHFGQGEDYALWHQPETTIEQLIIDYGAQEYVYLMTPEIAAIKLSVNSNIPIPREAWGEMLELLLSQNGIGIRQLNPFLRELYLIQDNQSGLKYITNSKEDLDFFPPEMRIGFMLSPVPTEVRRVSMFLSRFINPNTTIMQPLGRDILVVAPVGEIRDLLKLYDFVLNNHRDHEYKLVPLRKTRAEDMAQMLSALFDQVPSSGGPKTPPLFPPIRPPLSPPPVPGGAPFPPPRPELVFENPEANGLKIIVMSSLSQALFLVGTPEEIARAERMIYDVESQLGSATEKTIYWYITKHSDPEELAEMLFKIYLLMIEERILVGPPASPLDPKPVNVSTVIEERPTALFKYPEQLYQESYYESGDVAVNPAPVTLVPDRERFPPNKDRNNFIVDLKTGAIVMVVEETILPKLLEVIDRLDVPKKMVQIDVLMFEKRIRERTDYGLNLLRLGSAASQTHATGLIYNDIGLSPLSEGILSFFISRPKSSGFPAYDLVYSFLLSQDDVTINANPSVTTINQTPARIAIVDELSINTGVFQVETAKGVTLQDAFTRGQYGITMDITPTVHLANTERYLEDCLDTTNYITLETNVNFDTFQSDTIGSGRPIITRRNITNEVLIPDGQTLILGGLRRKLSQDSRDGIPFLCELPGIGKLFSTVSMNDDKTDMYIFITPKILLDPCEDIERQKCEAMGKRPGDIPAFMWRLVQARECEKRRIFAQSMKILWGEPPPRLTGPLYPCEPYPTHDYCEKYIGEYDGR